MLKEHVHITRRFLRSIRIDTDLTESSALEGFICPQSSKDVLMDHGAPRIRNQDKARSPGPVRMGAGNPAWSLH